MKPPIQYTKSGTINIAYQVFGSGPIDLVYIPGWVSNIDWMWECPELFDFLQELGKIARVILFDKRGTGLSDSIANFTILDERMDDIKAVMDAVGSEKAALFGHSEGGSVSALFAATYPNRTLSLITFGIFAKRIYTPDYPWAPTNEERQKVYDMIENNWGSGDMNLESLAPSKANDKQFMNWLANYFRSGASPTAAMMLTKMNTEVDIIDILGAINVPTLILQRKQDIDVKIEEGRFIAERIKNSKFVEFDGADHLFWIGNTEEIITEMKTFFKNLQHNNQIKKGLVTVLFGQLIHFSKSYVSSEMMEPFVNQCGGSIIKKDKKNFVAVFEVPSKAIKCSVKMRDYLAATHSSISMGVYMKEGFAGNAYSLDEQDDHIISSIFSQLNTHQILVTQTVRHLLSGSLLDFIQDGSILCHTTSKLWKLYSVSKKKKTDQEEGVEKSYKISKYDCFLEQVLQIINDYSDNKQFGIEMLTEKTGVSERKLQRKVKEFTGKSPSQLINSIRLNKAKEVLLSNNHTAAEVAFQFGFTSPSYFAKCFKKEFGITPTQAFFAKS